MGGSGESLEWQLGDYSEQTVEVGGWGGRLEWQLRDQGDQTIEVAGWNGSWAIRASRQDEVGGRGE